MNTSRISLATGALMIALAVLIDFAQFVLDIAIVGFILDSFITVIAAFIFGIWFSHVGVSLMHPKRVLGFLGTILGELIPGIDAIPFWTFNIATTVIREWRSPADIY